jgi:3-oxoacyl-[acyl-carrier-protein] synthase-3
MLEALRKKIKIPKEKFIIEMDTVGNTVSSTIPIALARAKSKGRIKSGDTAVLLGFGVGYSWGGTIVEIF